jgi:hypothetical protein
MKTARSNLERDFSHHLKMLCWFSGPATVEVPAMPTEVEEIQAAKSSASSGFWKRQFGLRLTPWQIAFDVMLGAVAPVICLIMDPGIFRWGGLPGMSRLTHLGLFAYLEIGICIAALCFYLMTRRASPFLAGILYAGSAFSLLVGIILLPLSIVGILFLIGFLGFTPFFTSFVFLRNARRCRATSRQSSFPSAILVLASAAVLTLMVPLGIHFEVVRSVDRAVAMLQTGTDQEAERAVHTLKLTRLVINADRLAIAYGNTGDKKLRERLARAFHEITGENVEDRLAALSD